MPGIHQANFPPVPHACYLRILFGNGVDRSPQEIQGLFAPTLERLDGERDEPTSRQGPGRIMPVFRVGGPRGSRTWQQRRDKRCPLDE